MNDMEVSVFGMRDDAGAGVELLGRNVLGVAILVSPGGLTLASGQQGPHTRIGSFDPREPWWAERWLFGLFCGLHDVGLRSSSVLVG